MENVASFIIIDSATLGNVSSYCTLSDLTKFISFISEQHNIRISIFKAPCYPRKDVLIQMRVCQEIDCTSNMGFLIAIFPVDVLSTKI